MLDQFLAPDLKSLLDTKKEEDIRKFLDELHPADIADILIGLDPSAALDALAILGKPRAAEAFRKLPLAFQVDIAGLLDATDLAKLIGSLASDDGIRLLKALPKESFEAAFPIMDKKNRDDFAKLSRFAEATAGSLMTTDYVAMDQETTIGDCLERIRTKGGEAGTILSVFALNAEGMLKGAISLAELIQASPDKKLSEIMRAKPPCIAALNKKTEAFYKFSRYDLASLPVVDAESQMIGLITHDDMISALEQERTADMERFMAISGDHDNTPYLHTSIWQNFRNRVGWLVVFALIGLLSGSIVQASNQAFLTLVILAFYMPMLANSGGIVGSQSAAIVVRAIALKEILPKDVFRVLWRETRIALLLGLAMGSLSFGRVMLTSASFQIPGTITILDLGLAIGIALSIQIVVSTLLGAALPFLAALFGANPAHMGSPALMTLADITGFFIYFEVASIVLRL